VRFFNIKMGLCGQHVCVVLLCGRCSYNPSSLSVRSFPPLIAFLFFPYLPPPRTRGARGPAPSATPGSARGTSSKPKAAAAPRLKQQGGEGGAAAAASAGAAPPRSGAKKAADSTKAPNDTKDAAPSSKKRKGSEGGGGAEADAAADKSGPAKKKGKGDKGEAAAAGGSLKVPHLPMILMEDGLWYRGKVLKEVSAY
jgi:hypothetical protein